MKMTSMLPRRSLRLTALAAILPAVLLLAGCSNDNTTGPASLSSVHGIVRGDAATAVPGATVYLARVNADGTLTPVSTQNVTSGADGSFTLETSLDNVNNLIVVATQGAQQWQAIVTGPVQHGQTVEAAPLNRETTVEAMVYERIVAQGKAGEVSVPDIMTYVDASLANQIYNNPTVMDQLATALIQDADAFAAMLNDPALGLTAAQLQALTQARLAAQASLDRALVAANGDPALIQAAYDAFFQADVEAFGSVGIGPGRYAEIRQAAALVLLKNLGSLPQNVIVTLARNTATLRAQLIGAAIEARWAALNANADQTRIIRNANITLVQAIQAAANLESLRAAYQTFHDAVIAQLQNVLPDALKTALIATDQAVRAAGGPAASLQAAVEATGNARQIVDAFDTFFSAVRGIVQTSMPSATPAQIDAVTEALILANMNF